MVHPYKTEKYKNRISLLIVLGAGIKVPQLQIVNGSRVGVFGFGLIVGAG